MIHRYIEIDLLRTLAITMMVVYHTAFDLWYFWSWNIHMYASSWEQLRIATFGLFLLLVGVSFAISADRKSSQTAVWKRTCKRSAVVLGCAMLITAATYIIAPAVYIRFGILHMIGISILLMPLFRPLKEGNILLGALLLQLERAVAGTSTSTQLLLPLGIRPTSFQSLDYYPLIPWFGIILIGLGLGHFLYIRFPKWREPFNHSIIQSFHILSWPGRHALVIYMVHQPIIIAVLWILHSVF